MATRSNFITRTHQEGLCMAFARNMSGLIADKVFPVRPTDKAEKFFYQSNGAHMRRLETRSGTDSRAAKIVEDFFKRNLTLREYKVGKDVNPRDVRDADMPEMVGDARAMQLCVQQILLDREIIAATLATTAANFATGLTVTLTSANQWDTDGGRPDEVKKTADEAARSKCGLPKLNAVAMDMQVARALALSPRFIERTKYTDAVVRPNIIAAFLDVDHVFIADSQYDSADEGATASLTKVWGDDVLFFHHNPSVGMFDVGFGQTLMINTPYTVNSYEDPERAGAAGRMRVVEVATEYVVEMGIVESSSSTKFTAGYLVKDVLQ